MFKDQLPEPRRLSYGWSIFNVLAVDIVGLALTVVSLLMPTYHYPTISFVTGAWISLDIGLWKVYAHGNCRGIMGRFMPKVIVRICEEVLMSANGRSLAELQGYACSAETLLWQQFQTGCDTVFSLRFASILFATFYILAAMLYIIGIMSLCLFWLTNRTVQMRQVTMCVHYFIFVSTVVGMVIYLTVGGVGLNFQFFPPPFAADMSFADLGMGFIVAAISMIWSATAGMWFHCLIPEKICDDSIERYEEQEDQLENDALLQEIREELALRNKASRF